MIGTLDQGSSGMLDLLLGFGHVATVPADGRDAMATSASGFGALLAALQSDSPRPELSAPPPIFGASIPFIDPEETQTEDPIGSEDLTDLALAIMTAPIAVENEPASSEMTAAWKPRADREPSSTNANPDELDQPAVVEDEKWTLGATQSWSSPTSSVPSAPQAEIARDAHAPVPAPGLVLGVDAGFRGAGDARSSYAAPILFARSTMSGPIGPDGGSAVHGEAEPRTLGSAPPETWMQSVPDADARRPPLPAAAALSEVSARVSMPTPTVPSAPGKTSNTAAEATQNLEPEAEHAGTAGGDARAAHPVREHIVHLVRTVEPAHVHVLRGEDRRRELAGALRLSASDLGRRLASDQAPATRASMTPGSEPTSMDQRMHPATVQGDVTKVVEAAQADPPDQQATSQAPAMVSASAAPAAERGREHPRAETRPDASPPPLEATTTVVRSEPQTAPLSTALDLGARLRLAIAQTIVDAGREQLLDSVRGRFEAQVTVQPAHLGTVHVQVTRTDVQGGLNVLLVAAHQDAARALEEGIDELVDELVRHRIEVAEVNVRRGGGPAHDAPRDGQQRSAAQDQNERERREDAAARQRADERDSERRRAPFARWGLDDPDVPHAAQTPLGGRYLR